MAMIDATPPPSITIHPLTDADSQWVAQFIRVRWGASSVVAHGNIYYPHTLPGFIACIAGEGCSADSASAPHDLNDDSRVGLVTYWLSGDEMEIVTLDSVHPGKGIGTALVEAAIQEAQSQGCRRAWLITTNDNLSALRFYQKRGFTLVAVYPNALERSRALKPEIPLVGEHGIPLRDEIELEYLL